MIAKIAISLGSIGFSFLAQCSPPAENPDITVVQVTEAQYEDFEVPDIPPYSELWVKMDWTNYNPDMRFRCANMGGYLVDDICHNVDY